MEGYRGVQRYPRWYISGIGQVKKWGQDNEDKESSDGLSSNDSYVPAPVENTEVHAVPAMYLNMILTTCFRLSKYLQGLKVNGLLHPSYPVTESIVSRGVFSSG